MPALAFGSAPTCPLCGSSARQMAIAHSRDLRLHRCHNCGLIYQASPPPAADILTMYDDSYYGYWGLEQSFDDLRTIKVKTCLAYLDLLERYLSQGLSSPQLLDIGCAYGFMLEAAQRRGFQACGIEISPAASVARERGFTVYDRPLHGLCLPVETFDVIMVIDVLEHMADPLGFMREVCRILKPRGVVLIVTPDVGSWIAKLMKAGWPHYKLEHIVYFNRHSLSTLLRRAGFGIERVGPGFKYLNFDYVLRHFQKYTRGWMTTLLGFLHSLFPAGLTRAPIRLQTEMLAIARRERPGPEGCIAREGITCPG